MGESWSESNRQHDKQWNHLHTFLEKLKKWGLLSMKSLEKVRLKTCIVILYWNWHSLYQNITPYKLWSKWLISTIKLHFKPYSLQCFWHILEHKITCLFTCTTLTRRAHFTRTSPLSTDSTRPYLAAFIFFQFSCSPQTVWVL